MPIPHADLVLALDLGTTGNRAILYDALGRVVTRQYRELPQYFPRPGWVEHNPMEILEGARGVLRRAVAAARGRRIAALGITNQRETIVVWDRKTGRPIHNAIVWQCRRTTQQCQRLRAQGLGPWIKKKTGLFLDPYFSAAKLQWILHHVPGAKALARQGRLLAGTVDTWVLWNVTGGKVNATDPSNASRTMLWNLHQGTWDKDLLALFDVPAGMLPQVLGTGDDFGVMQERWAGAVLPVRAMIGDQQASMFAQGCWKPGIYKNTYGTGLFLMTHTGHRPLIAKRVLSTVAWKLGKDLEYALEGSVFIGGAAVQWLRDGLKIIRSARETQALAARLSCNEGVYFVPAFVGLGAPHWDPIARGMIIGITRGTKREHLCRAALESMAFASAELVEEMSRGLGEKPKKLLADGGVANNDFLVQFQADLLNCPVWRSAHVEATALGAAMIAGLQAGLWDRKSLQAQQRSARMFVPRGKRSEMSRLLQQWKRAVERSKGWEV